MPSRVFISHASADKAFVNRLVAHLVGSGFPVWYDVFQLDLGSRLGKEIFAGIEISDKFLIVYSQNAAKSDWVERELRAILDAEIDQKNDRILIIRLDDYLLPIELRGRKFLSVGSSGVSQLFDQLSDYLAKEGLSDNDMPLNHALIPVSFTKGRFLERVSFAARLQSLRSRMVRDGNPISFAPEQFFIVEEPEYIALRAKAYATLDKLPSLAIWSMQMETEIRQAIKTVRHGEKLLQTALALLASRLEPMDASISAATFAGFCRSSLIKHLYAHQLRDEPLIEFGKDLDAWPLSDNISAEQFFGKPVGRVQVFGSSSEGNFSAWIPTETAVWQELARYQVPVGLDTIARHDVVEYLIPQMLDQVLREVPGTPEGWYRLDWLIGIS